MKYVYSLALHVVNISSSPVRGAKARPPPSGSPRCLGALAPPDVSPALPASRHRGRSPGGSEQGRWLTLISMLALTCPQGWQDPCPHLVLCP